MRDGSTVVRAATAVTGEEPSKLRTITIHSGVQVAARVFTLGCSFLAVKITAVELGARGYGIYTVGAAFVAIATVATGFGLPGTLARDLAKADVEADLLARSLALRAGVAALSLPVVVVVARLVYGDGPQSAAVAVLAPMVVLVGLRETMGSALLGSSLPSRKALLDVLTAVVMLGVTAVAAVFTTTTIAFLVALPLGAGASLAIGWAIVRPISPLRLLGDRTTSRFLGLVRRSAPFFKIEAVNRLYVSADALILAAFRPASEVGSYGIAYAVMSVAMTLPTVVVPVVLPHLVRETRSGRRPLVEALLRLLVVAAFPLACLAPFVSGHLVRIVSSEGFTRAEWPLSVLLVAAAVSFVNAGLGAALFAEDDERFLVRSGGVVAASNIVLNLVLDYAHGARGAAVAMVLTEVLSLALLGWRYFERTGHRPVDPRFATRVLVSAAGSALAGGIVLTLVDANVLFELLVVGTVAIPVYFAALFAAGLPLRVIAGVYGSERSG